MAKFLYFLNRSIKFIISIAIIYFAYLYVVRAEADIDIEKFKNTMQNNGYIVYKGRTSKSVKNVNCSYIAIKKDKTTKISYIDFNNQDDAYNYYEKFMNSQKDKYSKKISREIRFKGHPAQKQSYIFEDKLYIALYAKSVVIYTAVDSHYRGEVGSVFDTLYSDSGAEFINWKALFEKYIPEKDD
ncbi:MAG: hypothetical protein IJ877_00220 [Candidatus Gastranaerophilales bacterium]|nr:hypothetical protein [Candidatus Gastranaerophilales bacterium]